MFRIEHNVETGEITQIDLTPEEVIEFETIQAAAAIENTKIKAELAAKAETRAAILAKLGITEDEAKTLLS
jgi:hypothetical protein